MSLSAREQHALDCIVDDLARTDPKLASMLAAFTRLTAGEEMPTRESIRPGRRWRTGRPRDRRPPGPEPAGRPARGRRRWLDRQRVGLAIWLLIAVGLIAGAVATTAGDRAKPCGGPAVGCLGLAPADKGPSAGTLVIRRTGQRDEPAGNGAELTSWLPSHLTGSR